MLAGGCAGALSVCINNPVDVVKSRMQGTNGNMYKGTFDCFKLMIKQEGFSSLFKGLSARVPRLFCSQAIQFSVYEKVKELNFF